MNIIENSREYLANFVRLNEEWITQYFAIEEADVNLAANPFKIIEDGGYIFYLVSENSVLGVCALFNNGNGVFELARMAVSPANHGKGYGSRLIEHCLLKLKEINAQRVYLLSNTRLSAAISLYKKYGFETVSNGPHPAYARENIVMERSFL